MEIQNTSKSYHKDRHSVYSCQYHVVFCPKYRRRVLVDGIDSRMKELVLEAATRYGFSVLDMEVMPDHVHLLLDIPATVAPRDLVARIKGFTAHSLRREFSQLRSKLPAMWTRAAFISSVGAVSLEVVKRYIDDQKNV